MKTAFLQAIELVLSGDRQLLGILEVTMRMSIASSLLALLIGVPIGGLLSTARVPGRQALVVVNRTLTGVPR
ncbi:MAG: hypothetical protein IJC91_06495 [Oscillospiraceae bacterium]|nr:hypothetical protein [Oscillospiraceae bacterium]